MPSDKTFFPKYEGIFTQGSECEIVEPAGSGEIMALRYKK
jgi:hypothetical protein